MSYSIESIENELKNIYTKEEWIQKCDDELIATFTKENLEISITSSVEKANRIQEIIDNMETYEDLSKNDKDNYNFLTNKIIRLKDSLMVCKKELEYRTSGDIKRKEDVRDIRDIEEIK